MAPCAGSQDQLNFANGMQWLLFIACLLVIAVNVLAWVKLGRACASWEVVYVMGFVCESSQLPSSPSGCLISVQGSSYKFSNVQTLWGDPGVMLDGHRHLLCG